MGVLADFPHLCLIFCLPFCFGIYLVLRQMRPHGYILSNPCASGMQGNLFSFRHNAKYVFIPPDRYLFSDQSKRDRVIVVLKVDMAVESNLADTPVEKGKSGIR